MCWNCNLSLSLGDSQSSTLLNIDPTIVPDPDSESVSDSSGSIIICIMDNLAGLIGCISSLDADSSDSSRRSDCGLLHAVDSCEADGGI